MRYTIKRRGAQWSRVGYDVQILKDDGTPYAVPYRAQYGNAVVYDSYPASFFGDDGRTVRAEAIAWAKAEIARAAA